MAAFRHAHARRLGAMVNVLSSRRERAARYGMNVRISPFLPQIAKERRM